MLPVLGAAGPDGWPRLPPHTTLARCIVLAVLLHALVVALFGTVPGGTARPGEGVWGTINVTLRGYGAKGTPSPEVPLPDVGAPGEAKERRWGGAVRTPEQQKRPEEGPGAVREGPWSPTPSDAPPAVPPQDDAQPQQAPAPLQTKDMPRSSAPPAPMLEAPPVSAPAMALPAPARIPESLPMPPAESVLAPLPRLAPPTAAPDLAPLSVPLTQPLPLPQTGVRAITPPSLATPAARNLDATPLPRSAVEVPALPSAQRQALESPLVPEPALSDAAAPSSATPVPTAATPAAPSTPVTTPASAAAAAATPLGAAPDAATSTTPSATPAPTPTASPGPPAVAPGAAASPPSPGAAAPGTPDAGARAGSDIATRPSAPASAPRLNLALPPSRGGEIGRDGQRGLLNLLPPPPERKSKLAESIEKTAKKDCRQAYAGAGLLAIVPLAIDAVKNKDNCRW
jgi:hypothetical protein